MSFSRIQTRGQQLVWQMFRSRVRKRQLLPKVYKIRLFPRILCTMDRAVRLTQIALANCRSTPLFFRNLSSKVQTPAAKEKLADGRGRFGARRAVTAP